MSEKEVIFDFSNKEWKYKGVLSAIADNNEINKEDGWHIPLPKSYVTEIIGFIWVDEFGVWCWRARLKFPSGNKIVFSGGCGKNGNETKCLHEMYKFPLREKHWFSNPKGTVDGLLEVMKENDLIESIKVVVDDSNETTN